MKRLILAALVIAAALAPARLRADGGPCMVTYNHQMEEPGNLEISWMNTAATGRSPQQGFWAPWAELGYGVTAWWTSELYLEGQKRPGDTAVFTGWRLENRFRPLAGEHRLNPVLYFEFEDINEASRIQKEIVGHAEVLDEPNRVLRRERAREIEAKLILSSNIRDWNISENFTVEKNLSESEGLEFGYALGVSRPLSRLASGRNCRLCLEKFAAGAEVYGGLGSTERFGFAGTAHYVAPVLSWQVSDTTSIRVSAGFGLTQGSAPLLLRFGYTYEVAGFGRKLASLFSGKSGGRP